MTAMPPSPFCSAGAPHDAPSAETLLTEVPGKEHDPVSSDRFVLDEDKFLFDIGCAPDSFEKYISMLDVLADDPPPLFLQRRAYAE